MLQLTFSQHIKQHRLSQISMWMKRAVDSHAYQQKQSPRNQLIYQKKLIFHNSTNTCFYNITEQFRETN